MIEKNKKAIIKVGGWDVNVTIEDVEMYLEDVKEAEHIKKMINKRITK